MCPTDILTAFSIPGGLVPLGQVALIADELALIYIQPCAPD